MKQIRSVLAAMGVAAIPMAAQTAATPVGPMVGVSAPWMSGDSARFGIRVHALDSWGYRNPTTTVGLDVPLGQYTLGVTGGFLPSQSWSSSLGSSLRSGVAMGGVSLGRPISVARLGSRTIASLGVQASAGLRDDTGESFYEFDTQQRVWSESEASGALTLPMALSFRAAGVTVTPHIAPGIEFARHVRDLAYSTDGSRGRYVRTDTRLLFGTGLSLDFVRIGMGIDVFAKASTGRFEQSTLGIGIRWNGR